jgi:large subunit ribosomal protein L35
MPKIRTHKSTQKTFRLTGTGKVMSRHAFQSHNLSKKSAKRKRAFTGHQLVDRTEVRTIKRLAPYL